MGFGRQQRWPGQDPRIRRNAADLSGDSPSITGVNEVISLNNDGVLQIDLGDGLQNASGNLAIGLTANSGLEFSSGDLQLDLLSTGGLELSANELRIKLDGSSLQTDANGLSVVTANLDAATEVNKGVVNQAAARADSGETAITLTAADSDITDPADAPADADVLRDDLVDNTIPDIEGSLAALATRDTELETAVETLAGEFNDLLAKLRTAGTLNT